MRAFARKIYLEQAGQATIEYILVLVVTVGVVLGVLYQFNSAFQVWADNYFGEYVACLLETGELPSLGGESGLSGECNQSFKEFSITEGRPLVGDGITGEEESDGTGDGDETDAGARSYSGGGSGSTYAGRSRNSSFLNSRPERFRVSANGGDSGEEEGGTQSGNNMGGGVSDISGYQSGKAIRIPLREPSSITKGRRIKADKEEKKEKIKAPASSETTVQRQGPELIRVERKTATQVEAPDMEGFTFGKLFRYLLIAAIIIAVIIFIGGQILQVSKSME